MRWRRGETAQALIAFSTGLPAYVLIRVLQPGYFAREDTVTPTIFAGISVVANIVLSLLLFPSLLHVGIAIATSASAWLNAVLLAVFLARRGHFPLTGAEWRLARPDPRHSAGMAAAPRPRLAARGVFASGGSVLLQLVALGGSDAIGIDRLLRGGAFLRRAAAGHAAQAPAARRLASAVWRV